jgi:uncharacterized caspase-like protein
VRLPGLALFLIALPIFAGVKPDACAGKAKVRLLAVGVSQYLNHPAVNFAVEDARAVGDGFQKLGAEIVVLSGGEATRDGIKTQLLDIAGKSNDCDTFVFFFAGRANSQAAGEFYFYPFDAPAAGDLKSGGLSAEAFQQLVENNPARHVLILLDCGDASDFLSTSLTGFSGRSRLSARDVTIIAPQGQGRAPSDLQHGLISAGILQSLDKSSDLNGDGLLSAAELEAAVTANVLRHQSADGFQPLLLRARAVSSGGDFNIGTVGDPKTTTSKRGSKTPAQVEAEKAAAAKAAGPTAVFAGKYRALLIATDTYDHPDEFHKLNNPIRDAEAIEKALISYGFDTRLVPNPTADDIDHELAVLQGAQKDKDDELFVFVAGHGVYDANTETGYIIARDSTTSHRTQKSETEFLTEIKNLGWKHVFVVIDACQAGAILTRDGPPTAHMYQPGKKLEGLRARTGFKSYVVLTSGANDFVDDDEGNGHSPLANRLLGAFGQGQLDPEGLLLPYDIMSHTQTLTNPVPVFVLNSYKHGAEPQSEFWFVADPKLRVK